MPGAQPLLFPDPQPLVERLGRDFFRQLPARPGVYLMRDAGDAILYIGKAKNLRQRLGSYRTANPDRLTRRHLRLLRAVVRIEFQECPDEYAALDREAQLLRTLRPKFNRAGTWPSPTRFLTWRVTESTLHLTVTEALEDSANSCGPCGSLAAYLHAAVTRLLWIALHQRGTGMPVGWLRGKLPPETALACGNRLDVVLRLLEKIAALDAATFGELLAAQLPSDLHAVEKALVAADLELITDTLTSLLKRRAKTVASTSDLIGT